MRNPLVMLRSAVTRRLLGISPDEIRYTFDDVRSEIRAVRSEMREELAKLRAEVQAHHGGQDQPKGPEVPVAEA